MVDRIVKYNPAFLSDEELINNFVVRHADLQMIMRIIQDNVTDSNQHVLIIGPRGSGKTTLVRRVALEIAHDKDLENRWYPLIFSEESYEIVTAGEFWLDALFHLAEQTADPKWKRTYTELKTEPDDQRLSERALAQLMDFADSQNKRILLIVENLNMLFNDSTSISDGDAWRIRHALMNEKRLMLLGTATSRFENIDNSAHAMFEMYKIHELKPLEDDECNRIWELITGKKLIGEQIRPIRILTGGNLRLLIIIAKFSGHRSFGKLLDDLVGLIDDHTEYFKSHLDSLPAIERKVYLALAELWDPSTARDIAQAARLDVNKTSSFLNRLVGRGAVQVEGQNKKTKWYMVAERMYNIYYLMRRRGKPTDRIRAAVKFMSCIYDVESATRLIVDEASNLSPERCNDHYLAYSEMIKTVSDRQQLERIIGATPKYFLESTYINDVLKGFKKINGDHTDKGALEIKDAELSKIYKIIEDGHKYFEDGNYLRAIEKLDSVITEFKHSDKIKVLVQVANAMFNKGITFGALNRFTEEIDLYDEIIALYKNRPEMAIIEKVARAMVYKGGRLATMNRSEEAIQVYDEMIALYKDRHEVNIAEQIATAMLNKGICLGTMNRSEEAIHVYDEMIALYKDRYEAEIIEKLAMAMVSKGFRLGILNRSEEEIHVYDELITLYKERTEVAIIEKVAMAMINKGICLGMMNRSEEAIQVYDEMIALYKDHHEAEIIEKLAMAMVSKGFRLGILNGSEEEIHVYDELITLYKDRTEVKIAEQVATAMLNKGICLGTMNRSEEAIQVYDEIIAFYKDYSELEIIEKVTMAMVNKGDRLARMSRSEEEIHVYDEMIVLYKDRSEVEIVEQIAMAMVNKGICLDMMNRSEEAIQVYDAMIAFYKDRSESEIVEQVATAHEIKIELLAKQHTKLQNIRFVTEEAIRRYPDHAGLLNYVAWTLYKYDYLHLLNRAEEWIKKAATISPDDLNIQHTLACVLSAMGKGDEALDAAKKYIQDASFVEKTIDDAICLFVELAVSGYAKEAIDLLVNSPSAKHLEPLVIGLRLFIGEKPKVAVEILEVANDVVKRIELLKEKRLKQLSEGASK